MVWASAAPSENRRKAWYVGLFNLGDSPQNVAIDFASLGLHGKAAVRDLWKRTGLGPFKNEYRPLVPAHGSVLIEVTQ